MAQLQFKTKPVYENHFCSADAPAAELLEFDRLAIAEFLKNNIGGFQDHLANLDMDPEDADRIIGGLK